MHLSLPKGSKKGNIFSGSGNANLYSTCCHLCFYCGKWKTFCMEIDGRFCWRKSFLCYDLSLDNCGLAGLFCWCCTVADLICNCIISISTASLAITPIASMIRRMASRKLLCFWLFGVLHLIFSRIILMILRQGDHRTLLVSLIMTHHVDLWCNLLRLWPWHHVNGLGRQVSLE